MSETIDLLRPQYNEYSGKEKPAIPVHELIDEAQDLARVLETEGTRDALLRVGVTEERIADLASATTGTFDAERLWAQVRESRATPSSVRQVLGAAEAMRRELLTVIGYHFSDAETQAFLRAVRDGYGAADLHQDLGELRAFLEAKPNAFAGDETVDPAALIGECARLEGELVATKGADAELDRRQRYTTRNQAAAHLLRVMGELRRAGKYAFRGDPERAALFASAYNRKRNVRRPAPSETTTQPAQSATA